MTTFQTPRDTILRGSPSSSNRPLTVPADIGLSVKHYGGFGSTRTAVITFSSVALTATDNGGTASGGLKIADFPEGLVLILGAVADLSFTTSSVATDAAWVASLGTATAGADGSLTSTEANIIPSTAAAIASSAGEFNGVSLDTITALTDSTGRTPDDTIANHADLSTYATDAAVIEQNVSDLAGKINEIITAINGLMAKAIDGTATPVDLYLNMASTNDPVGNETITISGKIQITYVLLGENPLTEYSS